MKKESIELYRKQSKRGKNFISEHVSACDWLGAFRLTFWLEHGDKENFMPVIQGNIIVKIEGGKLTVSNYQNAYGFTPEQIETLIGKKVRAILAKADVKQLLNFWNEAEADKVAQYQEYQENEEANREEDVTRYALSRRKKANKVIARWKRDEENAKAMCALIQTMI